MVSDFIVFTLNGHDWRLTRVCWVSSLVFFILCGVMLTIVLRRYGSGRVLSQREAARVALHPAEPSYVERTIADHGPAMGKEWQVSMSIGDFRRAWHAKDYFAFFGLPTVAFLGLTAFGLLTFGLSVEAKTWAIFGITCIGLIPMCGIYLFMLWAAVYTKLE